MTCITTVCGSAHLTMPIAPAVFILRMFTTQQICHLMDSSMDLCMQTPETYALLHALHVQQSMTSCSAKALLLATCKEMSKCLPCVCLSLNRAEGPCVQDMAKSRPINMKGQKGFKMLVLNETDRLSAQAQHSLRRTMEKYSASCRLVLCCNNVSKVSSSQSLPLQHCTLMLAS